MVYRHSYKGRVTRMAVRKSEETREERLKRALRLAQEVYIMENFDRFEYEAELRKAIREQAEIIRSVPAILRRGTPIRQKLSWLRQKLRDHRWSYYFPHHKRSRRVPILSGK